MKGLTFQNLATWPYYEALLCLQVISSDINDIKLPISPRIKYYLHYVIWRYNMQDFFFDSAVNDKYNKLNKLLPPTHDTTYQLRQNRRLLTLRFFNVYALE